MNNVYFLYDYAVYKLFKEVKDLVNEQKQNGDLVWDLLLKRIQHTLWYYETTLGTKDNELLGLEVYRENNEYKLRFVFQDLTFVNFSPYWKEKFCLLVDAFFSLKDQVIHIPHLMHDEDLVIHNNEKSL